MYSVIRRAKELESYLGSERPVALDIETSPRLVWREDSKAALDPNKSIITGISFSTEAGEGGYVPLNHRAGRNCEEPADILRVVKALLSDSSRTKICHNLAFESAFFYELDMVIQPPVFDTLAGAMLTLKGPGVFRDMQDCGLKTLARRFFGAEMTDFEDLTQGRFFDQLDPDEPEVCRYACADADYALRLYRLERDWFQKYLPGHDRVACLLEGPAAVYTGLMRANGVPMNRDRLQGALKAAEARLGQLSEQLDGLTGGVPLGANGSTRAFKDYLFTQLQLPVLKQTEAGAPALDDEAILLLSDWCQENGRGELKPLFEAVLDCRRWQKIRSTYLEGYLKCLNEATGCIHPSLLPLATETGRFACRNPNLQNLPSPANDPVGVRDFMEAPEGWLLMEADYSQAEIRLAAWLAGEERLLELYRQGGDVHAMTTAAIFGISYQEASDHDNPRYKKRRTIAKGTMFGIMYGIGPGGLSRSLYTGAGLHLSYEACAGYISGVLSGYPRLAEWQTRAKRTAWNRQYAETAMGRRRCLSEIQSNDRKIRANAMRKALNTPVQGLCADCLKYAMGQLLPALQGRHDLRPVLTVHDSLVFLVKEESLQEAAELVRRAMEAPLPLKGFIPLRAEVSAGKTYGSLKEI